MTSPTPRFRSPWAVSGLGLLLVGVCFGLQGIRGAASHPGTAPAGAPTAGPRLVLRPGAVSFAGTISGGVSISGTLSPSLPGLNTIALSMVLPGRRVARGGQVELALSMPGMAMPPVRATLTPSGGGYRGNVMVPMFGSYCAEVHAATATGRFAGTVNLTLPLSATWVTAGSGPARP